MARCAAPLAVDPLQLGRARVVSKGEGDTRDHDRGSERQTGGANHGEQRMLVASRSALALSTLVCCTRLYAILLLNSELGVLILSCARMFRDVFRFMTLLGLIMVACPPRVGCSARSSLSGRPAPRRAPRI